MIAFGVVIIFGVGVVYTAIQRSQSSAATAAAAADDKRVQGGKAPPFLMASQGHGEIQAALVRPLAREEAAPPPAPVVTTAAPTTVQADPQPDALEEARKRAWAAYYQRLDALTARRFDLNMQALAGGNQQQFSGQPAGVIPAAADGTGGAPPSWLSTGGTDPAGQGGKGQGPLLRRPPTGLFVYPAWPDHEG